MLQALRVAPEQGIEKAARVADPRDWLASHVGDHHRHTKHVGEGILDGLSAVKGEDAVKGQYGGTVRGYGELGRPACTR